MSVTITMPLPPACLHPNARSCWQAKARAKKKARSEAAFMARHRISETWGKATVQATFYMPRKMDGDNLNAWLKAYLDGLQDAGAVRNDSGITLLPPIQKTGKTAMAERGRCVVLEITKI